MKKRKLGIVGVVTAALCASLFAGTAFAAGISSSTDLNANWTIPTTPMTNTIWKDAKGNVVPEGTEGATQYKVLTTWAEAWSTSGADYLGVSNSAYYGNGGNGNATITSMKVAQRDTTAGVWATSANTSPNAYNWNSYYNLYAAVQISGGYNAELSDWQAMISGANAGAGGTYWDTSSGVWCGFKYRPDVVVTSNNLSSGQAAVTIDQIQKGQYSATYTIVTEGEGRDATSYYYAAPDDEGKYDESYYVWGDENYDPEIMSYNNNSPYSFVASGYQLANLAQDVIAQNDKIDYPGIGADETVTWQTAQQLPRSNRYSESVMNCALNIEMLAKGSVYYTLSQIDQGNVDRKKVAYVTYQPGSNQSPNEDEMVVAVYDYTENIGTGPMDGRTSWTSLAVDQLGADGSLTVQTEKTGGSTVGEGDYDSSTTTYVLYYASADDIASCDVVYCSPNVTMTQTELQEWINTYATTTALKNRATEISYLTTWPVVTNGSNYTFEKFIYGAFGMDFIYPELFPSMELSCYWCDACYHLTDESITSAMSWIYSTASLPAGATLSDIPATYSRNHLLAKFVEGLDYFNSNKTTDATISRVLANRALDGTTTYGNDNPYVFNGFEPTDYWQGSEVYTAPDTSDLEAAIAEAEAAIASGSYTQGTQDALEVALAEAQEVLADANNAYADQAEVDAATAALEDAIAALQTQFTDVTDPSEYYYDAVYNMVAIGAITGYNETIFGVGDPMTRAQLVTIMWRYCEPEEYASYDEPNAKNESGLPDVKDGEYYTGAINWAVKNGVITGYEDGRFGPDDSITFDQMTTVVARYALGGINAAAIYNTSALNSGSFTDKDAVEDYARGPMSWAIENGLVTGNNNGDGTYTLDPLSDVARERATTVLWRAIEGNQI